MLRWWPVSVVKGRGGQAARWGGGVEVGVVVVFAIGMGGMGPGGVLEMDRVWRDWGGVEESLLCACWMVGEMGMRSVLD